MNNIVKEDALDKEVDGEVEDTKEVSLRKGRSEARM